MLEYLLLAIAHEDSTDSQHKVNSLIACRRKIKWIWIQEMHDKTVCTILIH